MPRSMPGSMILGSMLYVSLFKAWDLWDSTWHFSLESMWEEV